MPKATYSESVRLMVGWYPGFSGELRVVARHGEQAIDAQELSAVLLNSTAQLGAALEELLSAAVGISQSVVVMYSERMSANMGTLFNTCC